MNVIFLDFDGVINSAYYKNLKGTEEKIKILAEICKKYNCKVVISAAAKNAIDEKTLEIDEECEWVKSVFELFKKYGIECIGRTPNVIKRLSTNSYIMIWKEDEIRLYLFRHPEIEHFCVIDDDTINPQSSDLNKLREYLVKTEFYTEKGTDEGLLEEHSSQVGEILKKDNKIRKLALKRKTFTNQIVKEPTY